MDDFYVYSQSNFDVMELYLQNHVVGLNFADRDEAHHFKSIIDEKLNAKQARKMGKNCNKLYSNLNHTKDEKNI